MMQINIRGQALPYSPDDALLYRAENFVAGSQHISAYAGYRDRSESVELIFSLVQDSGVPMTRAQIAKGINRKKSTYVTGLINELIDTGRILTTVRINKWHKIEHIYWVEYRRQAVGERAS